MNYVDKEKSMNNINNVIYCNSNDTKQTNLLQSITLLMFWRKFGKKISRNVFNSELCDIFGELKRIFGILKIFGAS